MSPRREVAEPLIARVGHARTLSIPKKDDPSQWRSFGKLAGAGRGSPPWVKAYRGFESHPFRQAPVASLELGDRRRAKPPLVAPFFRMPSEPRRPGARVERSLNAICL